MHAYKNLSFVLPLALLACSGNFEKDQPQISNLTDDNPTEEEEEEEQETDADVDDDNDGFTENQGDCNDNNNTIHPNATEICNNVDDDCNGEADDNPVDGSTFYEDYDGDGYGDGSVTINACDAPAGYVTNMDDCDDTSSAANPNGIEQNWNDIDENCDGYDVDLTDCVEMAIASTASYLEGTWNIQDYQGNYAWNSIPYAEWQIQMQSLQLREGNSAVTQSGQSVEDYTFTFGNFLKMNDATSRFWFDISTSGALVWAGFDEELLCDGWVDETPASFDGTLTLSIDSNTQNVTGIVAVSSNRNPIAQSDVNLVGTDGSSACNTTLIDTAFDYAISFGWLDPSFSFLGDLLSVLDDSFSTTEELIAAEYKSSLEWDIEYYCSGN